MARHRTRYDKNALTFLGGVTLAALITYHRGMKDSVVEAFTFGVVTEAVVGFCARRDSVLFIHTAWCGGESYTIGGRNG